MYDNVDGNTSNQKFLQKVVTADFYCDFTQIMCVLLESTSSQMLNVALFRKNLSSISAARACHRGSSTYVRNCDAWVLHCGDKSLRYRTNHGDAIQPCWAGHSRIVTSCSVRKVRKCFEE